MSIVSCVVELLPLVDFILSNPAPYSRAGALAASTSAADAGLEDVVVLDPANIADGAAESVAPAVFAAAGTQLQREAGIDDSAELFADWWMELARGNADDELVDFIARESAETVAWLESLGVPFLEPGAAFLPASGPFIDSERAHVVDGGYVVLYEVLREAADERGVEIRNDAPVTSLIADDQGRVEGARTGVDGREQRLFAYEAVVLTGGAEALSVGTIPVDAILDPADIQLGGSGQSSDGIALAGSVGAAARRAHGCYRRLYGRALSAGAYRRTQRNRYKPRYSK